VESPDDEMPPQDMPLGPFNILNAAFDELKTWAATQGLKLVKTSSVVDPHARARPSRGLPARQRVGSPDRPGTAMVCNRSVSLLHKST